QLRTYAPTGDPGKGLGNNHATLEPAFLAMQRLTERLTFEGELRDWIPIDGTDFAGNVIRYGAALSYRVVDTENLRVTPVAEFGGWTVLSGQELPVPPNVPLNAMGFAPSPIPPKDATGDTIVNAKIGARVGFGSGSSLYIGYGHHLTGTV